MFRKFPILLYAVISFFLLGCNLGYPTITPVISTDSATETSTSTSPVPTDTPTATQTTAATYTQTPTQTLTATLATSPTPTRIVEDGDPRFVVYNAYGEYKIRVRECDPLANSSNPFVCPQQKIDGVLRWVELKEAKIGYRVKYVSPDNVWVGLSEDGSLWTAVCLNGGVLQDWYSVAHIGIREGELIEFFFNSLNRNDSLFFPPIGCNSPAG